ncbi:hypothetical protein BaRGS_00028699 [Batillaria attramentaria]|uniref:Phospholipase B-like n=1 Tax=Batillaria attramentaria TaxID=370345 RepID=A0ABD0JZC6_9CAEN
MFFSYPCTHGTTEGCNTGDVTEIYVSYDVKEDVFRLSMVKDQFYVAQARFSNCINSTGFAYLWISTVNDTSRLNSSVQAYAAGLAEGYITRELIALHYRNVWGSFCQPITSKCRVLEKFLRENLDWVTSNVEANPLDKYWYQTRLFYERVRGLQDGYNGKPGRISLEVDDISPYELEDIEKAVWGPKAVGHTFGHCSVLIKLLLGNDGVKDVLMAHDMWAPYNTMLRILKYYDFHYVTHPKVSDVIPGRSWAFSSYPGTITSTDDFYVLSSAMVAMETTNPIYNNVLYKQVKPQSVLESVRVAVANRLAQHGNDWSQILTKYNSGTYNNQWMVVDLKQYDVHSQQIHPGFLTVLEQIPYYPDIFKACGLTAMVSKYGDFFSHDQSPRARIFRRDHSTVVDVDSLTRLMRYNNFKNDPLARCNCTPPYSGENGISARSDLNPPDGTYPFPDLEFGLRGGIDMKLTSISLTQRGDMLAFRAISGPTFDPLPPFRWSTAYNSSSVSHLGQPDLWNFGPVWFNGTF